ncbi:hypothetical protein G6F57_008815 [Rhizopus arrhizus]|nr:hypothetical protein G6F30_009569 [Rhizopus arrhizus]KAG0977617.1 hypothetical protein G6F29_009927 [Rhizopus arrhizus]KAG0990422.1 hypothetical protein G6F28_009320 [Rhizopus arrhizus]KAG1004711.1 hypothetical protein G6F27_009886 [Rhizopus arrhizus]KAG1019917.1 hypothetical protein G6F26_009716 [Rhizopus arrhizus]
MNVRAAAQKLSINVRTAQGCVSKNNKDPQEYIQRSPGSGRPVGRPPVLTDEHKNYMILWADENTDSVVLEDMLDALTEKLDIFKSLEMASISLLDKSEMKLFRDRSELKVNFSIELEQYKHCILAVWKQHWRCVFDDTPWSLSSALALLQQNRHLVLPDLE